MTRDLAPNLLDHLLIGDRRLPHVS